MLLLFLFLTNTGLIVEYIQSPFIAGRYYDVKKIDSLLYVATNWGLEIFNWSGPEPQLISRVGTDGVAYAVDIVNSYAYVADYYKGICIINISCPSAPKVIGYYGTECKTCDISVLGDYAYLADWTNGLEIIDISDPQAPFLVGRCSNIGTAFSVTLKDTIAYVGTLDSTLKIVNVADPFDPFVIGEFPPAEPHTLGIDAYIEDTLAYVNCHFFSDNNIFDFAVANIRAPDNPSFVAGLDLPYTSRGIIKLGNYVFTNARDAGVYIINVANPSKPFIASEYTNGHVFGFGYANKENLLFIPRFVEGFSVVDVSAPVDPITIYKQKNVAWKYFCFIDSLHFLYLMGHIIGNQNLPRSVLKIIDITNPKALIECGEIDFSGKAFLFENSVDYPNLAVTLSRGYPRNESLYTVIVDISNADAPNVVRVVAGGGITELHSPYLFALNGKKLKIADIRNSRFWIDSLQLTNAGYDIVIDSSSAYITIRDSLLILDIFSGKKVCSFYHGKPYAINISFDFPYLAIPYTPYAGSTYGFLIFDISKPHSPSLMLDKLIPATAVYPISIGIMGCKLQDTHLYLGRGHYGFDIWKLEYADSVYKIITHETPAKATHCTPSGNSNIHIINNIIFLLNYGSLDIYKLYDSKNGE